MAIEGLRPMKGYLGGRRPLSIILEYRLALLQVLDETPEPFTDPWQMCREIAAKALGCKPGSPPVPEGYQRIYGGHTQPRPQPLKRKNFPVTRGFAPSESLGLRPSGAAPSLTIQEIADELARLISSSAVRKGLGINGTTWNNQIIGQFDWDNQDLSLSLHKYSEKILKPLAKDIIAELPDGAVIMDGGFIPLPSNIPLKANSDYSGISLSMCVGFVLAEDVMRCKVSILYAGGEAPSRMESLTSE